MPSRKPDIEQLYKVLRRENPDRVTLFELFLNVALYEYLAGRPHPDFDDEPAYARFLVDAYAAGGYDYATFHASKLHFANGGHTQKATISLNEGFLITDVASFDAYAWPDADACDYSVLDSVRDYLPANMKLMVMGPGGVLENAIALVGYDNLCIMLYEEPDLAKAIFDRIGETLARYYQIAAQSGSVGLLMVNDDWGFNTQTFLSPAHMKQYVFPWHKRIVEVGHAAGLPVLLHSCGCFHEIFADTVALGYDAKHSYEDVIQPVEQVYERWHDQIAILGGMDMDFMVRKSPQEITARCRAMLERVGDRGGYALGTGNSVPPYIPVENYLAMTQLAFE